MVQCFDSESMWPGLVDGFSERFCAALQRTWRRLSSLARFACCAKDLLTTHATDHERSRERCSACATHTGLYSIHKTGDKSPDSLAQTATSNLEGPLQMFKSWAVGWGQDIGNVWPACTGVSLGKTLRALAIVITVNILLILLILLVLKRRL